MANMSEEWRESIVYDQQLDEILDTDEKKKKYAQRIGLSGIKAKITGDTKTFEKRREGSKMLQRKMDPMRKIMKQTRTALDALGDA